MQGKRSLPTSNIRRLFPFRCRAGRRWDYNLCHCRQSGLCAHGQSVLPGTDIVIFSIQRQFLPLSLQTDATLDDLQVGDTVSFFLDGEVVTSLSVGMPELTQSKQSMQAPEQK